LNEEKAEVVNVLSNKIDRLEFQYFYSIFSNVYLGFRVVLVTLSLLYINVLITVILWGFLIVPLIISRLFKERLSKLEKKYQVFKGANLEIYENIFSNLKIIKSFNLRQIIGSKLSQSIKTEADGYKISKNLQIRADILNSTLSYASHVFILIFSVILVAQGHLKAGMVITLLGLVEQLSMPILVFARNLNAINSTKSIREDIWLAMTEKTENEPNYKVQKALETKNLSIYLDKSKISYKDLVIDFHKNYLIKGVSGIGKSLFIDLILKNRHSYEGEVLADGKITGKTGRIDNAALVETENTLFKESVMFNIFFDQVPKAEQLETAKELLSRQVLDSRSIEGLSSGEKRRVLLLRGLLSDKELVVFDEPTANLDKNTAGYFWERLKKTANKHFIVISHNTPAEYEQIFDEVLDFSEIVTKDNERNEMINGGNEYVMDL
jgi:ABC-type bacteriocin/lantibiotic exporter with double-glycine peptidase domain